MITYSGAQVFPENSGVPTLLDIAISLGRQPRFGGHTKVWWTVLHHSLVCAKLARFSQAPKPSILLALIHDAHESVTGDIPTTWKASGMIEYQADLDRRIFSKFGLIPTAEQDSLMAWIDRQAVLAEGTNLGPPGIIEWFGETPSDDALTSVEVIRYQLSHPSDTDGPFSLGVKRFVREVEECL